MLTTSVESVLLEVDVARRRRKPTTMRRFDPQTGKPLIRRWSNERFGAVWDEARARDGTKTAAYLASIVGVKHGETIYAWRRGEGKPDCDQIELLAFGLGVDQDEFKVDPAPSPASSTQ